MPALAALFPGQGSQRVGMGRDLIERWPALRRRWADADDVLGFALSRLCAEGPAEELARTEHTQPAVFVASLAALDVLLAHGVEPDAAAGHSLGEYAALVLAGSLDWEDGLRLVRRRGELMADVNARAPGAMAAVLGLPAAEVEQVCASAAAGGSGVVEAANYNEPHQVVVSGHAEAVAAASRLARRAGARVLPLDVGAPFHCSLMRVMEPAFTAVLADVPLRDPRLAVVAGADGAVLRTAAEVRAALAHQLAAPVRWVDALGALAAAGVDRFVDVGPGRVLTGLCRQVVPDLEVLSAGDPRRLDAALARLAPVAR